MTIVIPQCMYCKFEDKWVFPKELEEEKPLGITVCPKFPKGIPDSVEEGEYNCPEFKPEKEVPC